MSIEIELKLQLSPKAAKKLAGHPLLAGISPQTQHLLNTYYDTPKLELHHQRIAVRFRKKAGQWLLTVKSAEPASGGLAVRSEWETSATPGVFDFSHVDNAEFRGFLEQASPQFEPIFTTDFHRQIWLVRFGDSRIELAVDRGNVESGGKTAPICEIELELLSGSIDDIFGLTRQLQAQFDLHPAVASKAERGYALYLDQPARPFRAKLAPINQQMTPVDAFRSIALGCLEHFQRNEHGLRNKLDDAEFIHQARVALRRLRSAIKLFAPALPADFVTTYGATWRTLASALGETRNWDVFLEETLPPIELAFPENRDIRRLRKAAQQRAKVARRAVVKLLAIKEYPRLLVEFTAAVYALGDTLPLALKDFARERIARPARQARKLANRHKTLNAEERHALRIHCKKLRYALEFFTPLLPAKALASYLAALGQLQEELGLINDQVTASALLEEVLGRRNGGPIHGWIAGRQALLISGLSTPLETWLAQDKPWKQGR
jgi:inorganic triphosphatase YgiF